MEPQSELFYAIDEASGTIVRYRKFCISGNSKAFSLVAQTKQKFGGLFFSEKEYSIVRHGCQLPLCSSSVDQVSVAAAVCIS